MPTFDLLTGVAVAAVVLAVTGTAIASRRYLRKRSLRNAQNMQELREWRKTIIHEMFHKSNMETLSFEEIQKVYLKEGSRLEELGVYEDEISELELRRALIEMLASGVIGQTNNDEYFIYSHEHVLDAGARPHRAMNPRDAAEEDNLVTLAR